MLYWQLHRSRVLVDEHECIALLEFAETELVFTEFVRLLVRICDLGTRKDTALCERLNLAVRLEGFLRLVFFPALRTPYIPPPPPPPAEDPEKASDGKADNNEALEKEGAADSNAADGGADGSTAGEEVAHVVTEEVVVKEDVDLWPGFDDYGVAEIEAHHTTRKWPDGYE